MLIRLFFSSTIHPLLVLVVAFSLSGCNFEAESQLSKQTVPSILISLDDSKVNALTQIVDSIKWLPLQLSKEKVSLIGSAYRMRTCQDRIFIFDYLNANAVFAFDREGVHLFTIAGGGRGPDEANRVMDLAVNCSNNKLYLIDNGTELLTYQLDGQYLSRSAFPGYTVSSLEKIPNGFALQRGGQGHFLVMADENLNIIAQHFPFVNPSMSVGAIDVISVSGSEVLFNRRPDNKLYRIEDTNVYPIVHFVLPDTASLDELRSLSSDIPTIRSFWADKTQVNQVLETRSKFFLRLYRQRQRYWAIIDKETYAVEVVNWQKITDDLTYGAEAHVLGADWYEDALVMSMPAYSLREAYASADSTLNPQTYAQLKRVAEPLTDDSNTVLLYLYLSSSAAP